MRRICCTIVMVFSLGSAVVSTTCADEPADLFGEITTVFGKPTADSRGPSQTTLQPTNLQPTTLQPIGFEAAFNEKSGTDPDWCEKPDCYEPLTTPFVSDHEFDGFVEPITNPVFFEDPRSRTRLRFLFINQTIPNKSILGGGDFQVYAAQLSVALNERWTFIANKDGYITLQPGGAANSSGWADLAAGLKYVFVRDVENQFLLSGGILYELSNGSSDVFQGDGNGVWNFFLTTGKEFGRSHVVGTFGWHLPNDGTQASESIFYSLHLDHNLVGGLYAVWEMNGIHYVESGQRLPGVTAEGGDLINLGAGSVAGNDFLSMSVGGVYKVNSHLEFATAWEFPIGREDLLETRTTATLSLIY